MKHRATLLRVFAILPWSQSVVLPLFLIITALCLWLLTPPPPLCMTRAALGSGDEKGQRHAGRGPFLLYTAAVHCHCRTVAGSADTDQAVARRTTGGDGITAVLEPPPPDGRDDPPRLVLLNKTAVARQHL